MGVRVAASEKAKGASEGVVIKGLIADRRSEKHTEDIMRGEGERAWWPERLIKWAEGS
jgi:hypothetical protein